MYEFAATSSVESPHPIWMILLLDKTSVDTTSGLTDDERAANKAAVFFKLRGRPEENGALRDMCLALRMKRLKNILPSAYNDSPTWIPF